MGDVFCNSPSLDLLQLSSYQIVHRNRIYVYKLCSMLQLTWDWMLITLLFCSISVHMSKNIKYESNYFLGGNKCQQFSTQNGNSHSAG